METVQSAELARPMERSAGVHWERVAAFLAVMAVLTVVDNVLLASAGYGGSPAVGVILQAMMIIPAWAALVLQVFVWQDSPLHFRRKGSRVRFFAYIYLVYGTLAFWAAAFAGLSGGMAEAQAASQGMQLITMVGLLFAIGLQFLAPKGERSALGLTFGSMKWWPVFWLLLAAMYGLMTVLNYVLNLGAPVDVRQFVLQAMQASGQTGGMGGLEGASALQLLFTIGAQSVILSPLITMMITFGEEYGWRGFLQRELMRMGRVKGVALLGVIWGVWHAGVITMGHNYPGYPVAGVFLMILYTIALSFILGYAFIKSGSVWLAAFLHGVNNQVLSFLAMMVYRPNDPVFSFGIGVYAMPVLAIVVVLLLLDRDAWCGYDIGV